MTGCYTCGGGMGKHDPVAHGDWPESDNEPRCCACTHSAVLHGSVPGYRERCCAGRCTCPQYLPDVAGSVEDSLSGWWYMRPGESMDEHAARLKADPRWRQ